MPVLCYACVLFFPNSGHQSRRVHGGDGAPEDGTTKMIRGYENQSASSNVQRRGMLVGSGGRA